MLFRESETMELKEMVVDDIKKEIVAFANCNGGRLYVGVRDDGTVVGLDDPDGVSLQISNMARDAIKPDVTMHLHYETIEEEGKNIVAVEILRGTNRPYYLAKKGLRPEGVYVRQGYSSVPATDAAIRQMIKETDGDRFEAMRSLNQNLTFEVVKKEFERRKIDFGLQQMRTLQLLDRDGLYSNLALLLSDQCVHTIKVAVFQGTDQTVFRDRREFAGSLMRQMHDVYDYIDYRNQISATIDQLVRIDVRDYPVVAVREALLNLLVHRDYSYSASSIISLYADRIEFVSIGGLMPGLELEDIMAGISVCRNQDLASVFFRLHLIEAYGTGISKIIRAYAGNKNQPVITTTKNTFKILLPNINFPITAGRSASSAGQETRARNELKSEEKTVVEYAKAHDTIRINDVVRLLGVSASTASRAIRRMVHNNILKQQGRARNTYYTVAE